MAVGVQGRPDLRNSVLGVLVEAKARLTLRITQFVQVAFQRELAAALSELRHLHCLADVAHTLRNYWRCLLG